MSCLYLTKVYQTDTLAFQGEDSMEYVVLTGAVSGIFSSFITYQLIKNKIVAYKDALREKERAFDSLTIRKEEMEKRYEEKITHLTRSQEDMSRAFKALSYEALEKNTESFLKLASETFGRLHDTTKSDLERKHKHLETVLTPVKETLGKMDEKMQKLDKERRGEQEALLKQLELMNLAEKELRKETATLVKALRSPVIRGRWGELHLKRVVELSGMVNHCDFYEQTTETYDEVRFRPDLIIRLPGKKQIIVDAKTPFEAYIDAVHTDDEEKRHAKMVEHAGLLKNHILQLGKKAYWNHFSPTPEFVVLFVPSEAFFSAALEVDPTLIELGAKNNVILSTPTTLIGLLRAIAFGWKQEKMSEHAEAISALGKDLYKRISDMKGHWDRMGKSLHSAVESYNKGVGSLEARVLVSARKLNEYGAGVDKITLDPIEFIENVPKQMQAPEMAIEEE